MIIKTICSLLLLLPVLSLSGCQAFRPPPEIKYTNGASVDALSSNVSLSGRGISGSGYLMYRKPDMIRMVILSPFGSVLQEIYVSGELVTIIDVGNSIAFRGTYTDLPDKGGFSGWRYIHWLIDVDHPDTSRGNAVIERINRYGESEKAVFENGFLISKTAPAAGHVRYDRYAVFHGVAIPLLISYETAAKENFTILLEDPEINGIFKEGTFIPDLSKLRVYPLSSLQQ